MIGAAHRAHDKQLLPLVTSKCGSYFYKKTPPEVLEHPERHDYTINFILADFFGIVKEAYYVSKNIIT